MSSPNFLIFSNAFLLASLSFSKVKIVFLQKQEKPIDIVTLNSEHKHPAYFSLSISCVKSAFELSVLISFFCSWSRYLTNSTLSFDSRLHSDSLSFNRFAIWPNSRVHLLLCAVIASRSAWVFDNFTVVTASWWPVLSNFAWIAFKVVCIVFFAVWTVSIWCA